MLNFLFNIFNRKPKLVPIQEFTSVANIFFLKFSEGWNFNEKSWGGIYDFYNDSLTGVLQISALQHKNENYQYDIQKEFAKTKKKNKEIISLENEQAIMYGDAFGKQHQYCWIIGRGPKTAFITYTTKETDSNKLDHEFNEVLKAVKTFKITL